MRACKSDCVMSNTTSPLLVEVKNVYGVKAVYPACEKSLTFCAIAGKKTLSYENIERIKSLGYTIEIKAQTL